jgi:hypothetical protein
MVGLTVHGDDPQVTEPRPTGAGQLAAEDRCPCTDLPLGRRMMVDARRAEIGSGSEGAGDFRRTVGRRGLTRRHGLGGATVTLPQCPGGRHRLQRRGNGHDGLGGLAPTRTTDSQVSVGGNPSGPQASMTPLTRSA